MKSFPLPGAIRFTTEATLPSVLDRIENAARTSSIQFERVMIGRSRAGREMWGLRIGRGRRAVSITAGAHADEPVGPMTAMALAEWLASSGEARSLLDSHRFHICPQVNPDGAETNAPWFADPLDPMTYIDRVVRELPGDDIEYGYPRPVPVTEAGKAQSFCTSPKREDALRPENLAVAEFLSAAGPCVFHAALHGMGFSDGVWFLIGADWAERSAPLRSALTAHARELGFRLHDIDRQGEKGFTRIAPGYCTTPHSVGMRDFFLGRDDPETADLFHLSSMEFVQSLGGDPLLMVSELPLFTIGIPYTWTDPPGQDTPSLRFRAASGPARVEAAKGNTAPFLELLEKFEVSPTPIEKQVRLQGFMIVEALRFLERQE